MCYKKLKTNLLKKTNMCLGFSYKLVFCFLTFMYNFLKSHFFLIFFKVQANYSYILTHFQ